MQPLLHAHQSQTAGLHRRVHIEARTGVFHHQLNFTRETSDRYVEVACSAVLDRIMQSLLRHSEEAYRHVTGQLPGNVLIREHNVYVMLFANSCRIVGWQPISQITSMFGSLACARTGITIPTITSSKLPRMF